MKRILLIIIISLLFVFTGCTQLNNVDNLKLELENVINDFSQKYDLNAVDSDLEFIYSSNGYKITWQSSNTDIISNTGEVNRGTKNESVALKVKLHNGDYFYSKTIECTVLGINATDGHTYDVLNQRSYLSVNDLKTVYEDNPYSNHLDVISYIYHYHKLPNNYLTKNQAAALGWSKKGNVWVNDSLRGKLIGGDVFHNYEKILPILSNNPYIELDVNCSNGNRGKYRLVYNKYTFDIYYTADHYNSFTYMIGTL